MKTLCVEKTRLNSRLNILVNSLIQSLENCRALLHMQTSTALPRCVSSKTSDFYDGLTGAEGAEAKF